MGIHRGRPVAGCEACRAAAAKADATDATDAAEDATLLGAMRQQVRDRAAAEDITVEEAARRYAEELTAPTGPGPRVLHAGVSLPRLVQLSLEVREIDHELMAHDSLAPLRRVAAAAPVTEIIGAAMGPVEAAALLHAVADGLHAPRWVLGAGDDGTGDHAGWLRQRIAVLEVNLRRAEEERQEALREHGRLDQAVARVRDLVAELEADSHTLTGTEVLAALDGPT